MVYLIILYISQGACFVTFSLFRRTAFHHNRTSITKSLHWKGFIAVTGCCITVRISFEVKMEGGVGRDEI